MSESKALKYLLFKHADIETFADCLQDAYSDLNRDALLADIFNAQWDTLELKERMAHIVEALAKHLPSDFARATQILIEATGAAQLSESFIPIVPCDYVAAYGLAEWQLSMDALEILTQYGTAEGAIRPFILQESERTMAKMCEWTTHENEHVRRLASEGCRPRLPWNMALPEFKDDPTPILPILNALKNDPADYVQRSVANNLNDIAKDNPAVVIATLREWNQHPTPEIKWITSHGLRTLIKAGNRDALALLGYPSKLAIAVNSFQLDKQQVTMGDAIEISFAVQSISDEPQNLMIDYVLHAVKVNGKRSPKVWKLKKVVLNGGEQLDISKKHLFKPVTTRKYYAGAHRIELQINGDIYGGVDFELVL